MRRFFPCALPLLKKRILKCGKYLNKHDFCYELLTDFKKSRSAAFLWKDSIVRSTYTKQNGRPEGRSTSSSKSVPGYMQATKVSRQREVINRGVYFKSVLSSLTNNYPIVFETTKVSHTVIARTVHVTRSIEYYI